MGEERGRRRGERRAERRSKKLLCYQRSRPRQGTAPNVITYNILIFACVEAKRLEQALQARNPRESSGIRDPSGS